RYGCRTFEGADPGSDRVRDPADERTGVFDQVSGDRVERDRADVHERPDDERVRPDRDHARDLEHQTVCAEPEEPLDVPPVPPSDWHPEFRIEHAGHEERKGPAQDRAAELDEREGKDASPQLQCGEDRKGAEGFDRDADPAAEVEALERRDHPPVDTAHERHRDVDPEDDHDRLGDTLEVVRNCEEPRDPECNDDAGRNGDGARDREYEQRRRGHEAGLTVLRPSMQVGDVTGHGAPDAEIQEAEIPYRRSNQHPGPVRRIAQAADDERGENEPDDGRENERRPVRNHVTDGTRHGAPPPAPVLPPSSERKTLRPRIAPHGYNTSFRASNPSA